MNRYQHLDIAKGFGIILIVLAHNTLLVKLTNNFLLNIIQPFHIPLFFFISGVFIKESDSLKLFFHKKANSLLLPYLISISFVVLLKFFITNNTDIDYLIYNLSTILYSTGGGLAWPHLWFLTSLFTTIVFTKTLELYVFRRIKNIYIKYSIVIFIISIGYLIIGGKLHITAYHNLLVKFGGLPWSLDLIPVTFFYCYLGFNLQSLIKSAKYNFIFNKYLILLYFSLSILLSTNDYIDLNFRKLNNITIDTIRALLGIFFIIGLSKYITNSKYEKLKKYLTKAGRLSLIIYIFHYYFQLKSIELLTSHNLLPMYPAAILSFVIGLLCPLAIYFLIINKFRLLRNIYCR